MATPKSSVERVLRKIRLKKPFKSKDPNINGRVVPKKIGDNDPTRNHADLSEDLYNLYNGEEVVADPKSLLEATNKLISKCADAQIPLSFERLIEMRDELNDVLKEDVQLESPLPVKNILVPSTVQFCPHCDTEIGEKSVYSDRELSTSYHSSCGKPISFMSAYITESVEDLLNGTAPINPAYVQETINQLSDFYVGRYGVHAVMETELDGKPAILFITEDGKIPRGCPDYSVKVIAEKGEPFKPE